MTWILFSDSSTSITIEPKRGFQDDESLLRDEYRSISGKRYAYRWGSYRKWKFGVEFVNSAEASQISSWWYGNTKLLLKENSDSTVFSVQLVGENEPVTTYIAPHRDVFRGVIELESY